jgi:hypothetical protein
VTSWDTLECIDDELWMGWLPLLSTMTEACRCSDTLSLEHSDFPLFSALLSLLFDLIKLNGLSSTA